MKEAHFKVFGQLFCNDIENFFDHIKKTDFYTPVKGKSYTNDNLKTYISKKEYNGLYYFFKKQTTPFSDTFSVYSGHLDYINSRKKYSTPLNFLFSIDLRLNDLYNNEALKAVFDEFNMASENSMPNTLKVMDIEGLQQFFIDCNYELGINNFEKIIEDYSEHDEEFLFNLDVLFSMFEHKRFTKKLLLGDSYHYIKLPFNNKEVFSFSNDASEDYFFIFERDIETKNIRVFFDFMGNIDATQFKIDSCVVGDQPKIVHHYLENKKPFFISTEGNSKVVKNTQTYLLDDIEYIASNLAKHVKFKLPKNFEIR